MLVIALRSLEAFLCYGVPGGRQHRSGISHFLFFESLCSGSGTRWRGVWTRINMAGIFCSGATTRGGGTFAVGTGNVELSWDFTIRCHRGKSSRENTTTETWSHEMEYEEVCCENMYRKSKPGPASEIFAMLCSCSFEWGWVLVVVGVAHDGQV